MKKHMAAILAAILLLCVILVCSFTLHSITPKPLIYDKKMFVC